MKCNTLYAENYKYLVPEFCVDMILVPLTPILERGAVSKGGLGTWSVSYHNTNPVFIWCISTPQN